MKANSLRLAAFAILYACAPFVCAKSAQQAFAESSADKQMITCAPVLTKWGGIMEISSRSAAKQGDATMAEQLERAAFQSSVMGRVFTALAEKRDQAMLDNAWETSATFDRDAYKDLASACVSLYRNQKRAGLIPTRVEDQATKAQRAYMDNRQEEGAAIQPGCTGRVSPKYDVCATARAIATTLARDLPQRVNQNMTIYSAFATGKLIVLTNHLHYTSTEFDALLKSKQSVSLAEINEHLEARFASGFCQNPEARTFLKNGGTVEVKYFFSDGKAYSDAFVLSNCK